MEIAIFKEITTEDALIQLEAVAEKYTDLYCDMENKDERKFVKDKAAFISGIRKKIDRARIDKARDYKTQVEAEFEAIDYRLAEANKPFTLLIDKHKEARAKVLAEKKAIEDKKAMLIKIQDDHETAIMMNKIVDIEKEEEEKIRLEYEAKLKAEAAEQARLDAERIAKETEYRLEKEKNAAIDFAEQQRKAAIQAEIDMKNEREQNIINAKVAAEKAEQDKLAAIEQSKIEAEKAAKLKIDAELQAEATRKANTEYVTKIKTAIKLSFINHAGLCEQDAINATKALFNGKIEYSEVKF